MANSSALLVLFCSVIFLSFVVLKAETDNEAEEEEKIEKILRVQLEDNGLKIVTMSDGEMFVNLELTKSGAINDCKVVRRRRMALGMLKYDVSTVRAQLLTAVIIIFSQSHMSAFL